MHVTEVIRGHRLSEAEVALPSFTVRHSVRMAGLDLPDKCSFHCILSSFSPPTPSLTHSLSHQTHMSSTEADLTGNILYCIYVDIRCLSLVFLVQYLCKIFSFLLPSNNGNKDVCNQMQVCTNFMMSALFCTANI